MVESNVAGVERRLTPGMRRMLMAAGVLVALAGIQLFVFSERTDRFFAWTIEPPLTASFLGASYWASVLFQFGAARERLWANARIAVPTVFVFTTVTLIVTLVHLDRFHLGSEFELGTRFVTWVWIGIYALVPVIMAVLWLVQTRQPGGDPPRAAPLAGWVRTLTAIQAVSFAGMGIALLAAPVSVAWPWELTPLTGRAVGAWVLSLGVAAGHAVLENCFRRLRPAALAYTGLGVLQIWALIRFPADFDWSSPSGVIYLLFLATVVVVGVTGLLQSRRR